MPESQREFVFERLARLGDEGARGGRGLGLAYCRMAAQVHGGRIFVEDASPEGARFVVELPRSAAAL